MPWQTMQLEHPVKIVSLKVGQTVFGIYTGMIPSPKFPLTSLVTMERPDGEKFAFAPGLILQQWLNAGRKDLGGSVLAIMLTGKVGKCDTYKVSVWDGSLSELMKDRTYAELNMRLNQVLGV